MPKINLKLRPTAAGEAAALLAQHSGLPKARIKDAMSKGAVWLHRAGARRRLRRATTEVRPGDTLELFYDEELLALAPAPAECVADARHYSVWNKPAGVLAQGNDWGDHCALLRLAELHFTPPRPVFLVHRLDREASGLMLIAHTRDAAAALSRLFQRGQVHKRYEIEVRGALATHAGRIELELDGAAALTEYEVLHHDAAHDTSRVSVIIHTGRLHQIRRHFALIHHPVMGDPRYGTGNKNREGMRLTAVELRFVCPFRRQEVTYRLSPQHPCDRSVRHE